MSDFIDGVFETGEMSITEANESNVPVNCFLSAVDDVGGGFEWSASNFMPRKGWIAERAFCVRAKDSQTLIALVQKHVAPLYRAALVNLITTGENYYFELKQPAPSNQQGEE